jgi:aspartate/methionine/tyrosine aminotransferase
MTGWRLGYGVVPVPIAQEIDLLAGNIHSNTAEFTQYAGIEALQGSQESVRAMVKDYRERRDIIWEGLRNIPGITCVKPEGAFYVFPNVSRACKNLGLKNANDLQEVLLREGHVAVNSSSYYYQSGVFNENPHNLRLSYALSKDRILEGLRRMREAIGK